VIPVDRFETIGMQSLQRAMISPLRLNRGITVSSKRGQRRRGEEIYLFYALVLVSLSKNCVEELDDIQPLEGGTSKSPVVKIVSININSGFLGRLCTGWQFDLSDVKKPPN
jgi:hypothetical protein